MFSLIPLEYNLHGDKELFVLFTAIYQAPTTVSSISE